MINKLQFLHKNELFETREEAIEFLNNLQMARPSLLAEPVVLRYGNEKEPNVILAIGATGSGSTQATSDSSYFMIDAQGIKDDVQDKYNEIENALAKLALAVVDTDTLHLEKENTENGITLKGNVKVPETVTINRKVYDNIIKKSENGLYSYVNLDFDDTTNTFRFQVNENVNTFSIPVIKKGKYDISKEAIVFTFTDGTTTEVDVDDLIDEWTTEGENSKTPIVLTKERHTDENTNINDRNSDHWKDVLKADVRIASDKENNILQKTSDGRNLYVNGTADNIQYKGGENVEKALDRLGNGLSDESEKLNSLSASSYFEVGDTDTVAMSKNTDVTSHTVTADVKVSSKDKNTILVDGNNGLYASLDYDANRNVIIISDTNNDTHKREIQLNSVSSIEFIKYDKTSEKIIIAYKSIGSSSEAHTLEIPITDILSEWETNNSGHSVRLVRSPHAVNGTDELSGDVVLATEGNYSDNLIKKVTTTAYHEEMKGLYVSGEEVSGSARAIAKEEAKDAYDKAIESAKTYTDTQNVSLSGAIKTYVDNEVGDVKKEIDNVEDYAGLDREGKYHPSGKPYISGATSLADADMKLADAVSNVDKSITNLMLGSKTYSVNVFTEKDDTNTSLLKADVRLSVAKGQQPSGLTRTEIPYANKYEDNLLQIVKAESEGSVIELKDSANGLYFGGSIDYGMMEGDDTLNG